MNKINYIMGELGNRIGTMSEQSLDTIIGVINQEIEKEDAKSALIALDSAKEQIDAKRDVLEGKLNVSVELTREEI